MLSVFITPWMNPTSCHRAIERGLAVHDRAEELQILSRGVGQFRVVTVDRVVGQHPQARLRPAGPPGTRTSRRECDWRPRGSGSPLAAADAR